jgi:hypothetical protein
MKHLSKFLGTLLSLVIVLTSTTESATLTVGWNKSVNPAVAGYKVYYGTILGIYTSVITNSNASITNQTISNLLPKTVYYFVISSYDINKLEGSFSPTIHYSTDFQLLSTPNLRVNITTNLVGYWQTNYSPVLHRTNIFYIPVGYTWTNYPITNLTISLPWIPTNATSWTLWASTNLGNPLWSIYASNHNNTPLASVNAPIGPGYPPIEFFRFSYRTN